MTQVQTYTPIKLKLHGEYPDKFADLAELSKEDFLGYLFASFGVIQDQIQDGTNPNLPLTEVKLFRQAINLCNQAGSLKPLGAIDLRDIAFALISGMKLLLTIRDAAVLKVEPQNWGYISQIKYTNLLFRGVLYHFLSEKSDFQKAMEAKEKKERGELPWS